MPYKIGHWTNSVTETLEYLKLENDKGNSPKLKDLPRATFKNWIYPLKDSGYVINGDGFRLTEKGISLLNSLKQNPPTRKKIKNNEIDIKISSNYQINIKGYNLNMEISLNNPQTMEVIKLISELQKEK